MGRHHRKSGVDPNDSSVQGCVYIIVNDLIQSRVKIGYTMRDPVERALDLSSTGTTGTFVVIYEARVDGPRRVEQEVHRRLARSRVNGEWFLVGADAAVEVIRSSAQRIHYENTTARWHPSQSPPSEATKTRLATERAKAAEKFRQETEKRRQEAAERARQEEIDRQKKAEAERHQQRVAAENRRRDHEAQVAQAHLEAARQRKRREQIAVAIPMALIAILICGVVFAASMPSPPPSVDELDRRHRDVARLATTVSQEQDALRDAALRLTNAESKVQSLPNELVHLKEAAKENDWAVALAENKLVREENRQAEFARKWPDFRGAAKTRAEQDEKRFVDARIGEFLAKEDQIAAAVGRPMSPQGIDNNLARIQRETEPEAIAVFNESASRTMRKLQDMQAQLAKDVKAARQSLAAAQGKQLRDATRILAIPEELDRNRRIASELRPTVASLEKSARLVEVAYAEAKASLGVAERAIAAAQPPSPPKPRLVPVKAGRKT